MDISVARDASSNTASWTSSSTIRASQKNQANIQDQKVKGAHAVFQETATREVHPQEE